MVRARTVLSVPVPRGVHAAPSHLAIRFTVTPPAVTKLPPAYRLPLPSTAKAPTELSMPVPRPTQFTPSHWAMWLTRTPFTKTKLPPTYTLLPLLVIEVTGPSKPGNQKPGCQSPQAACPVVAQDRVVTRIAQRMTARMIPPPHKATDRRRTIS